MNAHQGDGARLAAEARARVSIDRQLADAGWVVQDKKALNLFAASGVACREVTMKSGHGRADYLLYVDQRVVGVIEAKPQGTTLSGVEWHSATYAEGLPADVRLKALTRDGRLPFPIRKTWTSAQRWLMTTTSMRCPSTCSQSSMKKRLTPRNSIPRQAPPQSCDEAPSMKPETNTVQELFERDVRYNVPLYQRPYVWERIPEIFFVDGSARGSIANLVFLIRDTPT